MLAVLSFLLFLRTVCLSYKWKQWTTILLSCVFAFLTILLFLHVPPQYPLLAFSVTAPLVALSTLLSLRKKPAFSLFKGGIFTGFLFLSFLQIVLSTFSPFSYGHPLLLIKITGKKIVENITWQNPSQSSPQCQKLPAYEVILSSLEGSPLGVYYIYGDFVALRARVLSFSPWLQFLGFSNLFALEGVHNGYSSLQREREFPSCAFAPPSSFRRLFFHQVWEDFFFRKKTSFLVKTALLQSNYFPLTDDKNAPFCGSYLLTMTESGLSSNLKD